MDDENQPSNKAWQPLTPRGVARFATGSLGRLLLAEWIVALIVAATVIWFCALRFSPIVTRSVQQLSEQAKLENGKLTGMESGLLADGRFLSITIDRDRHQEAGTADLQLKFRASSYDVCSLFGCTSWLYPNVKVDLSRSQVEPWWGAWRPIIWAGTGVLCVGFLLLSWLVFAAIYQWPARMMAWFGDRELSSRGSLRLATAAQLPAALFMAVAIVLYGSQVIDLARFLVFYALHFVVSWIYLFLAPWFLPHLDGKESGRANPFAATTSK